MSAQRKPADRGPPRSITKLISEIAYRHSTWQVFSDFVEMAAISVSNAVDKPQYEPREARYMEIVKRYEPEEIQKFPEMFASLTLELEDEPSDILGRTYHELELHNKWTGQYFSPYPLCQMMAKMTLADDNHRKIIEENGFIRASEPACGAGAMIIALADELREQGINYQQHLHVTAVDVDAKCCHMAFLQFSLLHIPAIVVHGNSLSLEEWGRWYTPSHIFGGWEWKLKRNQPTQIEPMPDRQPVPPTPLSKPSSNPTQLQLF